MHQCEGVRRVAGVIAVCMAPPLADEPVRCVRRGEAPSIRGDECALGGSLNEEDAASDSDGDDMAPARTEVSLYAQLDAIARARRKMPKITSEWRRKKAEIRSATKWRAE